jgi:alanine racemase
MHHSAPASAAARHHASGAILTIDLGAVAANYRLLRQRMAPARCGAVVKADAYGLGAGRVGPALFDAGCREFFVAHLDEGIALRAHLPDSATIYVMHGVFAGGEAECVAHDLIPVLNSAAQLARWAGRAVIQLDSGMARFGFPENALPTIPDSLQLEFVMSHLACADDPDHPANAAQLAAFTRMRAALPPAPASLVASSGIFLASDFHHDLARPGAALYGVAPQPGRSCGLHPVIRLDAKIVQLRRVPPGTPIGYGHTARTTSPATLATIAVGYADGYLRSGSNRGAAWFGDIELPILGRVSMDSIVLDASAVPDGALQEGVFVELIGPHRDVDAVAADAGTIGYEVLTSLGQRYHRRYIGETV